MSKTRRRRRRKAPAPLVHAEQSTQIVIDREITLTVSTDATPPAATPAAAPAPEPHDEAPDQAKKEWDDYPKIHSLFDGGFNEEKKKEYSYLNLRPLYVKYGYTNPAKYLAEHIVEVTFLGIKTPAHRDMASLLAAAQNALQPALPQIKTLGGCVPRRIRESDHLSKHALGIAVDIDEDFNPRITSEAIFNVIAEVTDVYLGEANSEADLRQADHDFRTKFNQAWVDAQNKALADAKKIPEDLRTPPQQAEVDLLQQLCEDIRDNRAELNGYAQHGFLNLSQRLADALIHAGLNWGGLFEHSKDFMHFELPKFPVVNENTSLNA